MTYLKQTYLLTLIFWSYGSIDANCQLISKGTLAVVVQTKQGLLIVVDRKVTKSFTGSITEISYDTMTKINPIGKFYGLSITGTGVYQNERLGYRYDAAAIGKKYLLAKGSVSIDTTMLHGLAKELAGPYLEILHQKQMIHNVVISDEVALLNALVYGYNVNERSNEFGVISLFYTFKSPPSVRWTVKEYREIYFEKSLSALHGKAELAQELMNGNDPRFDFLRRSLLVTKYLNNETKLYNMDKMIKCSKWIITETSKVCDEVGNTFDIAIINNTGFHWLERNSQKIN